MFSDVNENDARASIKAWGQTIVTERQISAVPESMLLRNQKELEDALEQGRVDAVGLTMIEFNLVREKVRFSPIFVTVIEKRPTEQYVLLASHGGKIHGIRDLAGARVIVQRGPPRLCLASVWLEDLLRTEGLPSLDQLAASTKSEIKVSKAVLPVFFGNADACLVTRGGFDAMCELNPQVGKRLAVVATSAEWIPAVFALRADYQSPSREGLIQGLKELHRSTPGRQVLTVFQSDRLEEADPALLESTLDFVRRATARPEVGATPAAQGTGAPSSATR
ncbi:MAG: PhnD/SsuA/transferrin family substrate-binding protein [Verrucomicrobiales bacterium]|nr:PhnD/SsuA/transferrin family substrate-binding protein [Verrucomicrobiales bacterium]